MMKKAMIFLALIGTLLLSGCKANKTDVSSTPVSPSPVPSPVTAVEEKVQLGKVKNTDVGLNIRKEASTDADVLGIAKDDSFLILDSADKVQDSWYKIKFRDEVAYVSAEFVEVKEYTSAEASVLLNALDSKGTDDSNATTKTPEPTKTPDNAGDNKGNSDSENSDSAATSKKEPDTKKGGNDGE